MANNVESRRVIVDTGNPVGIVLGGRFAREAGIKLLPDTRTVVPHAWTDRQVNINRGVADSLRIGDIVFRNLPVWVSEEEEFIYSDGILGLAELARLEYVEISPDRLVFPYPLPDEGGEPNFHMNAGYTGQGIFVPCVLNGFPYAYYFDTGSGTVPATTS